MDGWLFGLTIESILCLLFSIVLYFYFVRKDTHISVTIGSITVWFLTFVLIVFIPYDIYFYNLCNENNLICNTTMIINKTDNESVINNTQEIDVDYIKNGINILNILYAINYWLIFILSWLIIPIIKSYDSSGYFITSEKLKFAIKENIVFFIILIVVSIIGYIAICIIFEYINPFFLKNISIGLTLSWGLIQVFFFLGYSLVKLPKNLLSHYNYLNEKSFIEWEIQDLREYMKEIFVTELAKISLELKKTLKEFDKNDEDFPLKKYREYFNNVIDKFNEYKPKYLDICESGFNDDEIQYAKDINELALLHQNVKLKIIDYQRGIYLMKKKYKKWLLILSILSLKKNEFKDEIALNTEIEKGIKYVELSKTEQIYYIYIKPIYKISFAVISILLEIITLYGEISSSISEDSFSIMGALITLTNNIVLVHFITLLQIIFLFYLCFYTIFKMKVSFLCQMYGNRQTDSNSVLFVCNMMARIGFPICINFCQITGLTDLIINQNYGTGTMKSNSEGLEQAEHLYKELIQFFPLILILLSLLNLFNIFSKIGSCMGFSSFQIKNEDTESNITEGKNIFDRIYQKYGLEISNIDKNYLDKIIFNIN